MENIKEMLIVFFATIIYGVVSKALVSVPYMPWGSFGTIFFSAFILWWFYNSILYLAIKTSAGNTKKVPTRISQALLFGFMATIVKMGLDAITEVIIGTLNNMLVGVLIMEMVILIYGMAVILFLMICVEKRRIKVRYISVKKQIYLLIGCLMVYI